LQDLQASMQDGAEMESVFNQAVAGVRARYLTH
jgi:hypothetical protein